MFRTKSRTEQLTEKAPNHADFLAGSAATLADQLRERVLPAVGQATENAREWAKPRVEQGIAVTAPRLESAVTSLAPKVDTARDMIVDDLIPRLAEAISAWAAASAAARDEAVSRGQGAVAVLSGDAVASPKGKKKRVLLVLGVVGAGAAAAVAVMRKSAPKDDPWTTPLADPDIAAANGRHSVSRIEQAADTAMESEVIDVLGESGAPGPLESVEDPSLAAHDGFSTDADEKGDESNARKDGTDENPSA